MWSSGERGVLGQVGNRAGEKGVKDMPPAKLGSRSGASPIPDAATIEKTFAMLPVSTYEPGEMVITVGETTGKLLLFR